MKTKHFLSKKITYSLFGPRYYHAIKSKKILFDYLVGKDYEHIYAVLKKVLSKDDIILDIGANMGQYLLRLSNFVKEGKIICIEPIPQNVIALNYLKKKLKITNSTIIAKAVSNTSGLAKMTIPKLDGVPISTQATLLRRFSSDNKDKEMIEVETTTIDEIVESLGLNKINFIKIDTEGYDSIVLNSGYNTIRQFKPILKMEGNCFKPELRWLFEMGYIAFKLTKDKIVILNSQDEHQKFNGDTYLTSKNQLETIKNILMR